MHSLSTSPSSTMKLLSILKYLIFISVIVPGISALPLRINPGSPEEAAPSLDSVIQEMRFPFRYHSHARPSSSSSKRSLILFDMQHPSHPVHRVPLVVKPGVSLGLAVEAGMEANTTTTDITIITLNAIKAESTESSWKYQADMSIRQGAERVRAASGIAVVDLKEAHVTIEGEVPRTE